MSVKTLTAPTPDAEYDAGLHYSVSMLQDEARQLVEQGLVSQQQPIYVLCQHIPAREWVYVECELAKCEYLLRDRIVDLIGAQSWEND